VSGLGAARLLPWVQRILAGRTLGGDTIDGAARDVSQRLDIDAAALDVDERLARGLVRYATWTVLHHLATP